MNAIKTKVERKGLTKSNRIDWTDLHNILCVQLAEYGFHGQLIANLTGLTRAQVYTRIQKVGRKLRDYRDGETHPARIVTKKYGIRTITPTIATQLRKQVITPINF